MPEYVKVELIDKIALVTLDRPERLNAWRDSDRIELGKRLRELNSNPSVRAIVVTGAGDRGFCAGQDLSETMAMTPGDRSNPQAFFTRFREFFSAVRSLDKPIAAAVNGVAAGSGFQFLLLLDLVVAHDGVRMGQPEVNSGLPSITGTWLMQESLGRSRAVELATSGRLMDAAECHRLGLVHHIVPRDQLIESTVRLAEGLGKKSPVAMSLTKRAVRELSQSNFDKAFDLAIKYQAEALASGSPQEDMSRFFSKRAE